VARAGINKPRKSIVKYFALSLAENCRTAICAEYFGDRLLLVPSKFKFQKTFPVPVMTPQSETIDYTIQHTYTLLKKTVKDQQYIFLNFFPFFPEGLLGGGISYQLAMTGHNWP
jgi:hypothetical protein